jgi:hypothetical protein
MKIIMDTLAAGPEGVRFDGVEYNVTAAEGRALIAGGYAHSSKETSARSVPVENAAFDSKPRRRRRAAAALR